jgi:hypothetical protein
LMPGNSSQHRAWSTWPSEAEAFSLLVIRCGLHLMALPSPTREEGMIPNAEKPKEALLEG